MCLFEYDEEKHIEGERADAEAKGEVRERIRLLVKWVRLGKFSVDEAAKEAGMTAEEFEKILAEN